jgi:hypothetical protein
MSLMHPHPQLDSAAGVRPRIGIVITGLATLFLAFDGATKVIRLAPVVEASEKLGLPSNSVVGVGTVLLACTAIYAVPKTAILGAILLTGYLGGAVAVHVCARSGAFPVGFSIAFGLLIWLGLVLRYPQLGRLILFRQQ